MHEKIVPWKPRIKSDGSVELGVAVWDEKSNRFTLRPVGLEEYIQLWERKLLRFQVEKTEKPEHLPTAREVENYLLSRQGPPKKKPFSAVLDRELRGSTLEQLEAIVPKRKFFRPAPQTLEEMGALPMRELKRLRKSVELSGPELDKIVSRISLLTKREQDNIRAVVSYGYDRASIKQGIKLRSLHAILNKTCAKLQLLGSGHNRRTLLERVIARFDELEGSPLQPTAGA